MAYTKYVGVASLRLTKKSQEGPAVEVFQQPDTSELEPPKQTHNHERCDMDVLAIKDRERSVSITRVHTRVGTFQIGTDTS